MRRLCGGNTLFRYTDSALNASLSTVVVKCAGSAAMLSFCFVRRLLRISKNITLFKSKLNRQSRGHATKASGYRCSVGNGCWEKNGTRYRWPVQPRLANVRARALLVGSPVGNRSLPRWVQFEAVPLNFFVLSSIIALAFFEHFTHCLCLYVFL